MKNTLVHKTINLLPKICLFAKLRLKSLPGYVRQHFFIKCWDLLFVVGLVKLKMADFLQKNAIFSRFLIFLPN